MNRPSHPLVSVLLKEGGSAHVLRDGPLNHLTKTLCGRWADEVFDRRSYCCQHAWRARPYRCFTCSGILWKSERDLRDSKLGFAPCRDVAE
jgi:hypothetical protein